MPEKFVGFYWTFPVFWAGIKDDFVDIEHGAKSSKTIRYQRKLVQNYVRSQGGALIAERAFMEYQPDRGTDHIEPVIDALIKFCNKEPATIVYVNFREKNRSRKHIFLDDALSKARQTVGLKPKTITLDNNKRFNPRHHFGVWRARYQSEAFTRKQAAIAGLRIGLKRHGSAPKRDHLIRDELNAAGITTTTGQVWTDENVRKYIRRWIENPTPAPMDIIFDPSACFPGGN